MSMTPDQLPRRSANIFLSYRREDSGGHAGRLFDHLRSRFPGRVFMDVDTIEPGIDFVEVIEQAVGCCEVLLVVIGTEWLDASDADGRRRLDNPSDFVRLEIAAALERKIRVIPVLVKNAVMPLPDELPPDLVRLARRNAIEVSDARFAFDVDRLIHAIEGVLQEKAPSALQPAYKVPAPPPEAPRKRVPVQRRRTRRWAMKALFAAGLLALTWASWRYGILHNLLGSVKIGPWSSETPAATPLSVSPAAIPEATPAVDRRAKEPEERITPRIRPSKDAAPRKEATPQKDEPSKARRWWDSVKRKVGLDKSGSGPEQR